MSEFVVNPIEDINTKDFVRSYRAIYEGYDEHDDDAESAETLHKAFINQVRQNHDLYVQQTLLQLEDPEIAEQIDPSDISTDFFNEMLKEFSHARMLSLAKLYACLVQIEDHFDLSDPDGVTPSQLLKKEIDSCLEDTKAQLIDNCDTTAEFAYVCGTIEGIPTWEVIRQVNNTVKNPVKAIGNPMVNPAFFVPEFFKDVVTLLKHEIAFCTAATSVFGITDAVKYDLAESADYHNDLLEDIDMAYDKFVEANPKKALTPIHRTGLILN